MFTTHVILRTCNTAQVHNDWRKRYCGFDKTTLIKGCVNSLFRSIRFVRSSHIKLTILDDHSTQDLTQWLQQSIQHMDGELVHLDTPGYNHSAWMQWQMAKDSCCDFVYVVEDDYLHIPSALEEMIVAQHIFEAQTQQPVVLHPFDTPEEYQLKNLNPCMLVHGSKRHWRTGVFCTNTVFTRPQLFRDHWNLFETLALKYNGNYLEPRTEHVEESNTIWSIWREGHAVRLNPVPSIALHMQFMEQQDPFINWQDWWKHHAI